jgi:hypothetical protein
MNDIEAGHSIAPCRDTQSRPEEETPACRIFDKGAGFAPAFSFAG